MLQITILELLLLGAGNLQDRSGESLWVCSNLNFGLLRKKNSTEGHKAKKETQVSFRTEVEVYLKRFRTERKGKFA